MTGIIHIRPRHWFLIFTVFALVGAIGFNGGVLSVSAPDSFTFAENSDRVIIIDPGHGGFDGGAVGVNGTVEKDINLAISLKLRDMLTDAGFSVVMTRDTDRALNDSDDTTIRRRKISDMRNRLNLTKLYPGSVLISIHQNKLAGQQRRPRRTDFLFAEPTGQQGTGGFHPDRVQHRHTAGKTA